MSETKVAEAKTHNGFAGKMLAYLDLSHLSKQVVELVKESVPVDLLCDDLVVTNGKSPIEEQAHVTVHIGFDDPPKDNQILTSIGAPTVAFGDLAFFHNSNVFDVDQKRHERDVVYVSVDDVTGSIDALCTALEKDSGFPYPHPTKTKHITLLYAKYGSGDKVIELLKQAGIGKLLQGQHKCGQLHFKRVRDRTSKPLIVELDS